MPRKKCLRYIANNPGVSYYKPAGVPMKKLQEVVLSLDEFEAIRLADAEGLYHLDAAKKMKISRQTFGRVISSARKNVAKALIAGHAIKIEGGNVDIKKIFDTDSNIPN